MKATTAGVISNVDGSFQVVRGSPEQILVYFRESERATVATTSEQSVPDIDMKNLMSSKGRKLGVIATIETYQFRELFVQRLDKDKPAEFDSLLIKKDVPLADSPQVRWSESSATCWMNTPLKSY